MNSYFTDEFFKFFFELHQDNSKNWFDANRQRYVDHVREPLKLLIQNVIAEIKKLNPEMDLNPKQSTFRINRDIRFSKDKRPYKENVGIIIADGGKKSKNPGFYIHFGLEESFLATGLYSIELPDLKVLRDNIAKNPEAFETLMFSEPFRSTFGDIQGNRYKRLPKHLQEIAKSYPFLYNKQFFFTHHSKDNDWAIREDLLSFIMKQYRIQRPISAYLQSMLS